MVVGDAMNPLLWDYRWHVGLLVQKIGAMILEGLVPFITSGGSLVKISVVLPPSLSKSLTSPSNQMNPPNPVTPLELQKPVPSANHRK